MYQYPLFDIDETLLDYNRDMALAFERMYRAAGLNDAVPYSEAVLRLYNDCNERWWRRFEQCWPRCHSSCFRFFWRNSWP